MLNNGTTTHNQGSVPLWGRYITALTVVFICMFGALTSTRAGLSRLFSEYGAALESLEATERALSINSGDPEAHYARALRLEAVGRNEEAIREFEKATLLRPQDYFFWQELGRARDENEDTGGALTALQEAIALAPDYAQAHWQLGNLLLRNEQLDAGFAELRLAADSDPSLVSAMIDLAWSMCEGDTKSLLSWAQPRNDNERVLLAGFLVSRKQVDEAMALLRFATNVSAQDRQSLTAALLSAGKFNEAFDVWAGGISGETGREKIFDGSFEGTISNERSFGWKPTQATQTVHILLDPNSSQTGERSLRLDYSGGFDTGVPVVAQLVLVKPLTRYRLSFNARTEDLKSAALPMVVVKDEEGSHQIIAQSLPLPEVSHGWREFAIEFKTADMMSVITINIQRQPCSSNPCPIFGRAWFDDFLLKRI